MSSSSDKHMELEYKKIPVTVNGIGDILSLPYPHEDDSFPPKPYGYGVRHIQILLGFMSLSLGYIARAHLGVTVVAMTSTIHSDSYSIPVNIQKNITRDFEANTTAWEDMDYENETIFDDDFDMGNGSVVTFQKNRRSIPDNYNTTDSGIFKTYDWPKKTQEIVLGAFFLGYSIMMLPMGIVTQKFGGKLPMQIALFVNGVASIITPWMAAWGGWKAVCACRILQGLSQAGYYPSMQLFVSKWSSPGELGRFISWAFTGSIFGTVVAFQLAGLLSAMGWPYTFWVTGILCLTMFLILTVFGAASPSEHRSISDQEREFITGSASCEETKKRKVPVKAILTNKHVWASCCTHIGSSTVYVFFFSQVPTYIHYILDFNVKESGLLSSLPYITSFFTSIIYGLVSDFITNRNILSIKNARRISNSYSQFGFAICYIALSFTKNVELAIFFLVLSMVVHSAIHTGWMVNYIDLSPNFSASLMSLGNTISYATMQGLPILVSYVLTDVTNQIQWRILFITMAGLVIITNIIFVVFMSSDVQPWDCDGYEHAECVIAVTMKSYLSGNYIEEERTNGKS